MSNTAFLNNPDFPYSLSVLVRALFNLVNLIYNYLTICK